jgi:hypothetical protein
MLLSKVNLFSVYEAYFNITSLIPTSNGQGSWFMGMIQIQGSCRQPVWGGSCR